MDSFFFLAMNPKDDKTTTASIEQDTSKQEKTKDQKEKTKDQKDSKKDTNKQDYVSDTPHHRLPTPIFFHVKKLSPNAILPSRATPGSAGYDLASAENIAIPSGTRRLVSTQLAMAFSPQTYGRIASRSGLASKFSIDVGAGTIDSDYRGEVKVLLINHGPNTFNVKAGDRIAQLIIERIVEPEVVEVSALDETQRGAGGFGSTSIASTPKSQLNKLEH